MTFLSGETGFEKSQLSRFILAHKLARESIQAEFWFVLLGGSFYEFTEDQSLEEQLTAIWRILPSVDSFAIKKALNRGYNLQEIPEAFREKTDEWIAAFLELIASNLATGSTGPTFLAFVLDDAGITDKKKRITFTRLINEHKVLTPEVWATLEKDTLFEKTEIDDLATSFRLNDITHADFSVVKMIKHEFDVHQPNQIRMIAKKSADEWVRLVQTKYIAGEIKIPFETDNIFEQDKRQGAEIYGRMLEQQFRESFPTTAFSGGLERVIKNGGAHGLKHAENLSKFIDQHESFELLNTPVDDFLKNNVKPELHALAKNDSFRVELKAIQRVFKLAPTFEATDTLLADDLHFAQKIYRMGKGEFVRKYAERPGFTPEIARLAWNRAADTHAAVLTVVADLKALESEALPRVLKNNDEALSTFPNWNNLFKAGDLCDCEHCRSVLSPAAYFADLLMFLKDRKAKNPPNNVKDILFKRRSDLGFLELNCANALTPLPYIDTVCEVLEDAVDASNENDLELTDFTAIPLDPAAEKTAVAQAFEKAFADPVNNGKQKIDLGADFSLSQVSPSNPDRWVVHSDNVTYLLKKKPVSTDFFAEILRNTKVSAAELRAYPQYVNPKAYEKLRAAKYPLSLPFDLFTEEVRAAFQKTNLQRWDLMRTLRGTNVPNNPTDGEIAAEYFGVSADATASFDEKRLILTNDDATVSDQQEIWGGTEANWLDTVSNVKNFLRKTSLEYNELLALLDLKFINPADDITIYHRDPSCNTDQKFIQVLDESKLDRIHRFLRLWRKLKGWKMWELDLVIRHPRIGNGALDEQFLVNLFYFSLLRNRLGVKTTVEQVCALFGNLNTETRFTKLHEKREEALYQNLFLNRRLINPLDPAFEIDPANNELRPIIDPITGFPVIDPSTGLPRSHSFIDQHPVIDPVTGLSTIIEADHQSVILAALGTREADLTLLKGLTKGDGTSYITDDLTLGNLSFLWRHTWLSKLLKFKAEEWRTILKIFQQDILQFADQATWEFIDPKAAWEFIEQIDRLKTTGFTPDELNWLLAADRSAKAAVKEADAARFLTSLRKDLQAVQVEFDPRRYDFLSPPRNVASLTTLLTSLLQKLKHDETGTSVFLKTLRGAALFEADVQGLEADFTFPAAITNAPNNIPIRHESVLRFSGLMTAAQQTTLLNDPSLATVNSLPSYQQAIQDLFEQAEQTSVIGLPDGFIFPATITGAPNNIPIHYESVLRFNGIMTDAQRTVLLSNVLPAAITDNISYANAIENLFQQSQAASDHFVTVEVEVDLVDGLKLPVNLPSLPIRYSPTTRKLSFIGVMSDSERQAIITAGNLDAAIDELFWLPRLAVKFYENIFTASLEILPAIIDFKAQLRADLAARINYDVEHRLLCFKGIMGDKEQSALNALAPPSEVAYHNAVNNLAVQPKAIALPDSRIWLTDNDLDPSLPVNNTLAKRIGKAANKALDYLSNALSANNVVQQISAQLDLSEALTRYLLSQYTFPALHFSGSMTAAQRTILLTDPSLAAVTSLESYREAIRQLFQGSSQVWVSELPASFVFPTVITGESNQIPIRYELTTLFSHFIDTFAATAGAVDYITLKSTLDSWFWVNRVTAILKKWKLTLAELERINALTTGAQLFDFLTLPLNDTASMVSIARFLRTNSLLRFKNTIPETKTGFLEVLHKLNSGAYTVAASVATTEQRLFAADVERLNEAWGAADVEALTASLDLAYPADYLLAESWERLRRAFYFLDNLNAGADTVKDFAAAAMTDIHAKTIKELLRSKFGTETWLTLSAEIQDVLRERKRDALAAYLLTHPLHDPKPADAPSDKWESTSDLYAYYLLDVEMSSCQLTSRLVQGTGSVQLFVQRCFMGLEEPEVVVKADRDDDKTDGDATNAWSWWQWMSKYRVWEANRKVFLWPENWIEPELKKDRSPFFKDLENELLQNEINQHTVETAFTNYLEKLDGVAQLEIAGFYQEDDGENTIIHVFGRTSGAEPHLYYYRQFDYRQWTPWEKVDLDIQGDYLIPAMVNKRLYLFWPIFTEVPDEARNNVAVNVPSAGSNAPLNPSYKKLKLQMAVSEFRQGAWTPKRISKDFALSQDSFHVEIVRKHYQFLVIESTVDLKAGISYGGWSLGSDGIEKAWLNGIFNISSCNGAPELVRKDPLISGLFLEPSISPDAKSTGIHPAFMKWVELGPFPMRDDYPEEDFTLISNFSNISSTISTHIPPWLLIQPERNIPVLDRTPGLFSITPPWQTSYLDRLILSNIRELTKEKIPYGTWLPFFYSDKERTFFVLPLWDMRDGSGKLNYPGIKKDIYQIKSIPHIEETWQGTLDAFLGELCLYQYQSRKFHFKNFYHPFVCDFAKLVYNPLKGIPALMSRETQLNDSDFNFDLIYQPTANVVELPPQYSALPDCYPRENVDFTPDGACSPYNWELFFHVPLLIANSLSKNQRFEEAQEWYHFIFNPLGVESATLGGSPMSKYWITKPFFQTTDSQYIQERIDNILRMLSENKSGPNGPLTELENQVHDWRTHPFEPHRIANYRTVTYQKTVIMKYLDNLIAWGDYLFRQDSMESINEATQLYILMAEILGPRPKKIPPQAKPTLESFNELEEQFDRFSNALVEVENLVPALPGNGPDGADQAPLPMMLYFCIPHNDKMLEYWDMIADRLYKIRHCMNIEGVVRQLALFEPPIDPGALVKAVAGGVDISSALADLNVPLPFYRFNMVLQKANEVCNDVKTLGGALLAALEKKDAEEMALLRQGGDIKLLEAIKILREKQIEEAKESLEGLKKSKVVTEVKRDYYQTKITENIIPGERQSLNLLETAHRHQTKAQSINIAASMLGYLPNITIGIAGVGGSPNVNAQWGIGNIISALQAMAGSETQLSNIANYKASKALTLAGYTHRLNDWDFQHDIAVKEIEQIDKSIAAGELRLAIAEKELENHIIQIENAKVIDEFMRSKYTNQELYQWQVGQVSGVYFQSYKLAYDLAKQAERCFRFELGFQDSNYIQFGYWDSLKKGLLSGEKLQYDLRRLETAYLEQNRREFELTKHISLALLDPFALVKLRETGRCFINLQEEIFDLDFPGHYFRRIKSVSITLPCVVGPYTTISCTLRLLKNSIRINTTNGDNGYPRNTDDNDLPTDDHRFIENNIPVKSIATSNAQNDSGVFELSFRDERYLPFEGAGAISQWSLELFNDLPSNNPDPGKPDFGKPLRQFDYDTISDAIIHIKYTAREDVGPFKNGAIAHLRSYFSQDGAMSSLRLFNLRQEFPAQWHHFLNPTNPGNGNIFELEMSTNLFRILDQGKVLKINTISLIARCSVSVDYNVTMTPPLPELPSAGSNNLILTPVTRYGGLHFGQKDVAELGVEVIPADPPVKWLLEMTNLSSGNTLRENEVKEIFLVVEYKWD